MQPSGYITCTPEEGELIGASRLEHGSLYKRAEPYQIPWTAFTADEEPIAVAVKQLRMSTPAEEIFEQVKEWYRVRGTPVPISDAKMCLDMIKAEKKEPEPEKPKTLEEQLGPKPAWGDSLFWDYWRRAKALGFTNEKKKK